MTEDKSITLGRAWDLLDECLPAIATACPELRSLLPAGDVRRVESLVSDVVIVGEADEPEASIRALAASGFLSGATIRKPRVLAGTYRQASIEVHLADQLTYGSTLFRATGSSQHIRDVERLGLDTRPFASEAALYASVTLDFIAPELRQGTGEVAAAAARTLPTLVDAAQIRGDLHMHTTYSDGRDQLEVMVAGAHALGYEYIAITDHSARSAASRSLALGSIDRQRGEIDELRARFSGMTILHGIEVDIMPDGRLDFADDVLESFDIVLASLHDRAGQGPEELTQRSLGAVRHPLVNILCHPANQLVGHHPGYELDFDALFEAAVETGTALEIDGAPSHMDLDGAQARAAAQAGVTFAVDSDCHRVEALGRQMGFGVGTARRGWIEARQVVNTRPLAQLRAFIAAKRGGRPA